MNHHFHTLSLFYNSFFIRTVSLRSLPVFNQRLQCNQPCSDTLMLTTNTFTQSFHYQGKSEPSEIKISLS